MPVCTIEIWKKLGKMSVVNKKIIAIAGVIILLLIGIFAYLMSTKNKAGISPASQTATTNETAVGGMKSLRDLMTAGVAQKCTFKSTVEGVISEGTTYVAGGKMRGDFITEVEGKTTTGHSIYDGKMSYVWMDGNSNGFKMAFDTSVNTDADVTDTTVQQGLDINQELDYNCSVWITDQSLLTPPANITFMEFSVPTITTGTGTPNSLCSSCNSLTGDQKTQCLTALKCN